jgi:2',3'-cyclic-nucleotide 2'-phosphodiesterase (5'-nucleotidase family)
MWAAERYHEKPDFAVYNYGGIRAALPAGDVTRGDVLDVAPFENKICFGTLRGADVLELFQQFMVRGPHGVSHGVELVFDKDLKLRSAKINGKPVDPEASYRFTTIDYVAHGNDGMTAFSKKFDFVEHKKAEDNSRDLIIEYFRDKLSRGETINPKLEGRIQIEN